MVESKKRNRGKLTTRICKFCNIQFEVPLIRTRAGKGIYCGRLCANKAKSDGESKYYKGRKYNAKYYYGISHDQFKILIDINKCEICNKELLEVSEKFIDHCHVTNKVRGVLCSQCNSILGFSKDNILILENAIKYLQKSKT